MNGYGGNVVYPATRINWPTRIGSFLPGVPPSGSRPPTEILGPDLKTARCTPVERRGGCITRPSETLDAGQVDLSRNRAVGRGLRRPDGGVPTSGALDPKRVQLGKELFRDKRFSADGTIACSTCHDVANGGDDGRRVAIGIGERSGRLKQADARRLEIWSKADMDFVRSELPIALGAAGAGLKHISRIVLGMKEFSHPGSEELQPADINRAIDTTITVAKSELKYVAQLHTDFGVLPTVHCNVSSFNQVMLNLIVNAAQAIGERVRNEELGNIWIKTSRLPAHVEIRVEDDGPGVPETIREQIFDPFFTTKEVGKGTGQGLSIAYRVVCQQHGGTLTMEPRAGGGACFVIRLPVPATEPAAATQAA